MFREAEKEKRRRTEELNEQKMIQKGSRGRETDYDEKNEEKGQMERQK